MSSIGIIHSDRPLRKKVAESLGLNDLHQIIFSVSDIVELVTEQDIPSPGFVLLHRDIEDIMDLERVSEIHQFFRKSYLIIIGDCDRNLVLKALENGACSLLRKSFPLKDLDFVINEIEAYGSYLPPAFITRLIVTLRDNNTYDIQKYQNLTVKEKEITKLVCEGKCYKEIAFELKISFHTVNYHLKNIYLKFEVNSKSELVFKLTNQKAEPKRLNKLNAV